MRTVEAGLILLRLVAAAAGVFLVVITMGSAIRTVILPRGIQSRITSGVFSVVRRLYMVRVNRLATYEERDRAMSSYAPFSLLLLLVTWLILVGLAYMLLLLAAHPRSLRAAFIISGGSVFTLGYDRPGDLLSIALSFSESGLGLVLLALLITYLPSIYGSFSRREVMVSSLEVRAGSPPSGVVMLERFHRLGREDELHNEWEKWETWFLELEETHTSFPALAFFRSPQPDHSWVTAAGAILDAAALYASCIEQDDVSLQLTIRAGYIALRRICDFFGLPYGADPAPGDPVSISREEFDEAYQRLAEGGIAMKADRDLAWKDFAGWRVNYDACLLQLASLTMAPFAPWSSDRGLAKLSPAAL